jgi:hypothetical protein
MTLDDALHYTAGEKQKIIAQYPEHERATRTRGIPAMGSGRVFLVDEEKLLVEPMSSCPRHWVKLGGCDFGWDHPAAFVEMWWDRDMDVLYLVHTLRLRHKTPLQHVEAVRHWRLRWAWPHDGRNQTLAGAGVALARQYQDAGLDMMHEHATFEDGGMSVEAGVQEMHDRMRGGRWKVFRCQNDEWLEEYGMYHRKDGLLVQFCTVGDSVQISRRTRTNAFSQHLWQLGNAPRLVARHQVSRRSPAGLILEIHVGERVPVGVADNEALPIQLRVGLLGGPRRWEAARFGHAFWIWRPRCRSAGGPRRGRGRNYGLIRILNGPTRR